MIARALAQEPKILLLDEPTAFLDIRHQVEILDLARNLNRTEGVTVIAITHDINLASLYCDRIVMLKNGSVHCTGTPEAVVTQDHIQSVYGINVIVDQHPVTACPRVTMVCAYPSEKGSRCETGAAPQL
jgi:iron complex transport system ATP-binding protein